MSEHYGEEDKRTCKVKRNIALLYLKLNEYEKALDELREVEVSFIRINNSTFVRNLKFIYMVIDLLTLLVLTK